DRRICGRRDRGYGVSAATRSGLCGAGAGLCGGTAVLLDARQTHVGRLSLGSHPRAGLRLSERALRASISRADPTPTPADREWCGRELCHLLRTSSTYAKVRAISLL